MTPLASNKKLPLVLLVLCTSAVVVGRGPTASNIDPSQQSSWSENLGWMNWRDADATNNGVVVSATTLSGFVWFENGGWMNVGNGGSFYANTDGTDFGVNMTPQENLLGFAWSENAGWVNFGWGAFSSNPDRARIDVATSRFRGFAWSENNGWINLDDSTHYVGSPSICGQTSRPVAETLALPGNPESTKNRFLSVSTGLGDAGQIVGMRVTFELLPPPFDLWDGSELWVGPASAVSEAGASAAPTAGFSDFNAARLQCTPFYADFSAFGVVHVFHEGIVPGGQYRVDVIDAVCDVGVSSNFSHPITMTTADWGDTVLDLSFDPPTPPEGVVNVVDALAVLEGFSGVAGAMTKPRSDLEPACVDLLINVTDVLSSIAGFSGLSYPFTLSTVDPCNSTCPNPLP